jgi:hypothetical protein
LALGAKIFETFIELQNKIKLLSMRLAVAFGTVSSVVNQVVDRLRDAYKTVQEATGGFDALGKILKNVILIPLNLLARHNFCIEKGLLTPQAAWEMSFLGGQRPGKTCGIK